MNKIVAAIVFLLVVLLMQLPMLLIPSMTPQTPQTPQTPVAIPQCPGLPSTHPGLRPLQPDGPGGPPAPPNIPDQKIVSVTGRIVAISPVWTMNGDGDITVRTKDKVSILIQIIGSPSMKPPTKMELKVKYLKDALYHKVLVEGVRNPDGSIMARLVREL